MVLWPSQPVLFMWNQSVSLLTLFLHRWTYRVVNQFLVHILSAGSWQLPFLNQKWVNDHRKYFMISLHKNYIVRLGFNLTFPFVDKSSSYLHRQPSFGSRLALLLFKKKIELSLLSHHRMMKCGSKIMRNQERLLKWYRYVKWTNFDSFGQMEVFQYGFQENKPIHVFYHLANFMLFDLNN